MIEEEDNMYEEFDLIELHTELLYKFPQIEVYDDMDIRQIDEMIKDIRLMRLELSNNKNRTQNQSQTDLTNPLTTSVKNKPKLKEIPHKVIYKQKEYDLDIKLDKTKDKQYMEIKDQLFEQELILKSKQSTTTDINTFRAMNLINQTDAELDDLDKEIDDLITLGEQINDYIDMYKNN